MKQLYIFLFTILFSFAANSQVIYIDPGHGYGTSTSDNPDGRTTTEIESALAVGLKVRTLLQNSCPSVIVHMSRTTNVNGWSNVSARALQAQNWNADRLLSIHCNADGDATNDAAATSTANGTESFYGTDPELTANAESAAINTAYATKVQAEVALKAAVTSRNSGVPFNRNNLGIFGRSTTACLNEMGFVDNASNKAKLLSETGRDNYALGFFTALKSNLNMTCNGTVAAPGTFSLTVTPACTSTVSQVNLSWTASTNATSYDVYRNGILWDTNVTVTTYVNTTNVVAGTIYTYSVKAKNTGTTQVTNSNGTLSVTALNCATPGTFTLTATPQCATTTSRVNLSWTDSANATSYDIYRNGILWDTNITTTSYINTTNVVAGTTYTYSVKAKNSTATQTANSNGTLSVTAINCATPGSFTLTVTSECSASATSQNRLNWTASANATAYDVYRNGVLYQADVIGNQYINSYLITGGTVYTYSVKAKNTIGQTTNSNGTLSVTATSCIPGTFTLSTIADCATTTSRINLTWTTSAGATAYDIYRNGNLYASDVTGNQFLNTYLITAGLTYTFSMVAKNSVGTMANSNGTRTVTAISCLLAGTNTPVTAISKNDELISNNIFVKNEISVYPNPTEGEFFLNIDNVLNKALDITIFSLTGQSVYTKNFNSSEEVINQGININHLPSGIYLIKISVDGKEYNKKIIKK
ncbi:N-acetylmuramoyl-L-alanine amidase [Flavobacterium sp.]|uniref:N-acetylmuramoyl-L-alanine amidase n=1 Tax=Flavobacterium sp. TaxID=239 RepID=UPI00374D6885